MKTTNILKNRHFIGIALCFFTLTASAQLKVGSNGKVVIATPYQNYQTKLTVGGTSSLYPNSSSVGVFAAPTVVESNNNIALEGIVTANQNFSNERNYGVLGYSNVNGSHGRNYGVCGMVSFDTATSNMGGAGIYGTNYGYVFYNPDNLQSLYAGYFHGATNFQGQTTIQELYTPADSRLSEDVESLETRDDGGSQTLDNLLSMNVLEFNLKNHQPAKTPDDLEDVADEVRAAYDYMKKDEEQIYSRRHFGLSAQELQTIYPNLVLEGHDGYLYVNYTEMVPLLIRSIQELKAEINELKGIDTKYRDDASGQTVEGVNSQQAQITYPITVDGKVIGTKKKNLSR